MALARATTRRADGLGQAPEDRAAGCLPPLLPADGLAVLAVI